GLLSMMPTDSDDRPAKAHSMLGRFAACLWFLVVTGLFTRGLVGMMLATPTGGASFSDWSAVMSRCCQIVFFVTLGWLMLARPNALARREGVIPTLIAFSGTYSVWLIPFLPSARISPSMQMASAVISLIGC